MRFAFVVSNFLGYQIPNLFASEKSFDEFEGALTCLRENGFEGVELNLYFDDNSKLSRIRNLIDSFGLKLVCVGTGLIYALGKMSLTTTDAAKRARALSLVKGLTNFAAKDHAPVVIGLVRGARQLDADSARVYLRESIRECDIIAREGGTKIAIEALNRYETDFLNTAREVANFIEAEKLTSTGILLDTFHMNIEERSIEETLREHRSKLAHFYFSDSNRWPPGYGHLRVEEHLRLLQESNYEGWVSGETLPKPSSIEAVEATAKFLRSHKLMENK